MGFYKMTNKTRQKLFFATLLVFNHQRTPLTTRDNQSSVYVNPHVAENPCQTKLQSSTESKKAIFYIGTGGPCFKTRLRVRVLLFSQTRGKMGFLDSNTHTGAYSCKLALD
ncbi:hypothetical protein PO909_006107 [Leuciscus waleckii]